MPSTSSRSVEATTKSGAVLLERLDRPGRALLHPREQQLDVLAGEVGVLLGARERELLLDDLLGQHEPRVVVAGRAQVAQRAEGVEAREARRGQPPAGRVEPQRGRAGQDPDAVVLPDRVPVADALDVVPHPVGVDHPRAGGLGDAEHPAVHVRGHPGDHGPRRRAQPGGPGLADQVVVAADAAAGDDHGLRAQLEVAGHHPAAGRPRSTAVGSSTAPRTPTAVPPSTTTSSTRCRNANRIRPARRARAPAARTARPRPARSPR